MSFAALSLALKSMKHDVVSYRYHIIVGVAFIEHSYLSELATSEPCCACCRSELSPALCKTFCKTEFDSKKPSLISCMLPVCWEMVDNYIHRG